MIKSYWTYQCNNIIYFHILEIIPYLFIDAFDLSLEFIYYRFKMNEDNKYIHILSQPTITPSMNDGKTMEEEIQSYKKIIKKIKEWENYKQGISKPIISMAITNMLYFFQVHSVAKYESNEDFIVKALILHTMKVESSRKEYFRLNKKIAQKRS